MQRFVLCLIIAIQLGCRKRVDPSPRERLGVLEGTVVDPSSVPLASAWITALRGDGRTAAPPVRTSPEGHFVLSLRAGF